MNIKSLLILLALVLLAGACWAMPPAEEGPPPPPPGQAQAGKGPSAEKMIARLAKDLRLTTEQSQKILDEVKKNEAQTQALHEKNREMFDEIEKELLQDKPDRQKLQGLVKKINDNNNQIQIGRIDQLIKMREQLTPEQKAKMKKIMEERKTRAGRRGKMFRR